MFNKLSSKVLAGTVALVIICSIAFLYLSMKEHEFVYRGTVFNHLEALATNMADDLVETLNEEVDSVDLATKLLDLEVYDNVKYAIVYSRDWDVLQQYIAPSFMQTTALKKELPPFNIKAIDHGVSIYNGSLMVLKTIGDDSYPLGHLLIVNGYREPLDKSNHDLIMNSLPVALIILLTMIALAILFSQRLLSPLSSLTQFTESIESSSNYHLRFEAKSGDEVANLGNHINSMLERIDAQNTELQVQVETLEEQQQTLQQLANFDVLTKLPNRKFFMEVLRREMARVQRRSSNVIVLFLDLDDFKGINDSLGHEAGDSLLIKVSDVIAGQLREGDVLARLGGDEFLILLNDINEDVLETGINVAERIIHSLEIPIVIRDWEIQTGVSIGIADAASADFQAETLIRNADVAMYHAKESGRNTYALFQQELQAESMRKLLIANALTKALLDEEFKVNYQVKVGKGGKVNGLEALIRWESSFDGIISPGEFIPVAEHSGKITAITRWVLRRVFKDLPQLVDIAGKDVVVSINLSAFDIKDIKFIQYIESQLQEYHVAPQQIEFEITESAYLDNFEEAKKFFQKLGDLGFSIALDDFGTGYSSMSYLTRIAIDTLKIDQAFVRKLEESSKDKLIIEAIIGLAHNLGLNICAEGVETAGQRDYLLNSGCQQLQGYFYAKPAPLTDLPKVITDINQQQQILVSLRS